MSIVLYDFALDEGCYKVRLMLSALGIGYETVAVDVSRRTEQRTQALLRLDPRGAVPILVDSGLVLREPEAIIAYLARRYDPMDHWLPADDPALFGQVMMWLCFAADALRPASHVRLQAMFEIDADLSAAKKAAKAAFRIMDDHMTAREFDGGEWFVAATPTVADIALFPPIALSRDVGIEHDACPALRRWMRRIRTIPGFMTIPGIPDYY